MQGINNFRTEFSFPGCGQSFNHLDKVLAIGSCFSDMIGNKLLAHKFDVLANPFGVIFNPITIFELLSYSLTEQGLSEDLLLCRHGKYFHYQLHSSIYASGKDALLQQVQEIQVQTSAYLKKSSHIFITMGTAFVYEYMAGQVLVANCHKQPQGNFKKILLTLDSLKAGFDAYYQLQKKYNPGANIVITVSPVRHIKDGMMENQLSKSLLRIFCHHLQQTYKNVYYFPSYELMMDDLRDYRFYKEDMIHPNEMAENYIWDKFKKSFFETETIHDLTKIEKLNRAVAHRPFDALSLPHKQFLLNLLQTIDHFPEHLDFSKEIKMIQDQIQDIETYFKTNKE